MLWSTPAAAHPLGQKPVLLLATSAEGFGASWIVAPDDARALADHLGLGPIRPETMHEHEALGDYLRARLVLHADGERCEQSLLPVEQVGTGYAIQASFACADEPRALRIRLTLLHDIDERYQTLYQVRAHGGVARGVLTVASPVAEVDLAAGVAEQPEPAEVEEPGGLLARITASLQGSAGAAPFALALVLALALGALHALTPGHGKALTAAYMVGAGGTVGHGVLLGGVVALAHAAGTGVLGAVAIGADRVLLPAQTGGYLELATGLLVIGLAVVLARARPHEHDHAPVTPSMGRLALVGLVGGLVPSPDAIAIVLVAFSLERWTAGAALVAAFSIGLAAVVLAVAVVAARGGSVLRSRLSGRFVRYAPRAAAAVFAVLGVVMVTNAAMRL